MERHFVARSGCVERKSVVKLIPNYTAIINITAESGNLHISYYFTNYT